MIRPLLAVAQMTFREAVRDRVLYVLLAFALVLMAMSRVLALLTVGSESRIVADTGLAAIAVFGVLTGVFLGVALLGREIERRTAHTVLARPISRWTFVAGKYLGLLLTLAVNAAAMSAAFLGLLLWRGDPILPMLPALWLTFIELAVVTALALFYSAVSTSALVALLFTLATYVAGHLVWSLPLLVERLTSGGARAIAWAVYYALPHLDRFNVRAEAVHGDAVPLAWLAWQTAYGLGWALLLVLGAGRAFARRDLA